jgi:hypothetical protein
MNNCCPGMCKGEHAVADMIPQWAVCRGGSGKDEEPEIDSSGSDPVVVAPAAMD